MTWEEYAALEGLNFTVLKEGRKSMKHLRHRMQTAREDTIRLGLGRASHCLVLTPDEFPLSFAVYRGKTRRGKEWDTHCAANPGRTTIKVEEYARCVGMRDSLRAHLKAGPLIASPGECEKVITWTDPLTEILCKARIDKVGDSWFLDLKTAADIEEHHFGSLAAKYGYHLQAAWYRMGLRANGMERQAKIVAVEAAPPFDVGVFTLDDDALYPAEVEIRELLDKVAVGLHSGIWPGQYDDAEVALTLPAWVFPDADPLEGLGLTITSTEEEAV